MRESVGAGWLTQIVIVFILLFAAIVCYAVNYGKAFKVKNQIVEDIEKYGSPSAASNSINSYLSNIGYHMVFKHEEDENQTYKPECVGYPTEAANGANYYVCLYDMDNVEGTDSEGYVGDIHQVYYKVYVQWGFDLPILGNLLKFNMSGTTKQLPYDENWK